MARSGLSLSLARSPYDRLSRTVMALWKTVYSIHPALCPGCRPLELSQSLLKLDYRINLQETIVQRGFPVQVLHAETASTGTPGD